MKQSTTRCLTLLLVTWRVSLEKARAWKTYRSGKPWRVLELRACLRIP